MKLIAIPMALALLLIPGPSPNGIATAGGYDHGKATDTCSITPNPAAVGQLYTVGVTGLSLDTPDYLIIIPRNKAGYTGALEQPVYPDTNGNWSGTFVADDPEDIGKWTYEFDTTSEPGARAWRPKSRSAQFSFSKAARGWMTIEAARSGSHKAVTKGQACSGSP